MRSQAAPFFEFPPRDWSESVLWRLRSWQSSCGPSFGDSRGAFAETIEGIATHWGSELRGARMTTMTMITSDRGETTGIKK